MAVIEIDGVKLETRKLMKVRITPELGSEEMRLILPTTNWNTSGKFLLHSLTTGRVQKVDNIVETLRAHGLLDDCLADE